MQIPNGVIFIWSGTHALIPSGWSRANSFDDGIFPKGTATSTDPNTTGGAATHTHTSTAHSHATAQAHTHTITIPNGSGGITTTTSSPNTATAAHNHGGTITSGAVGSFSTSSVAATYAAFSNNPPFYSVIYVTPTTSSSNLPSGIICLADAAITGMNICDGTASTPNLVDKYLNGAASGADAGTTGGTTTNTHGLSHSHTTSHIHAAATSGSSSNTSAGSQASGGSLLNTGTHTHSVDLDAGTPSTTDNVTLAASAETVEPAYTKLLAVQAPSTIGIKKGIIGLWTGLLSAIPLRWTLCDGTLGTVDMRSRHLKITGTVGDVGTTGGSNTHTHASQNHGHTVAHTHTKTLTHSNTRGATGSGTTGTNSSTTHSCTTDSVNLVIDNAATTADSSNNEPTYRTVAFIKLNSLDNPQFLLNFV